MATFYNCDNCLRCYLDLLLQNPQSSPLHIISRTETNLIFEDFRYEEITCRCRYYRAEQDRTLLQQY